ncbi:MAG: DUF1467 family protein [Hyphomonadaceae bacterium]
MLDPLLNIAIFIIWWWVAFFIMLPIGVRSVAEAEPGAVGHDPGAPVRPDLKRKAVWAAILAALLWALTVAVIAWDPVRVRG